MMSEDDNEGLPLVMSPGYEQYLRRTRTLIALAEPMARLLLNLDPENTSDLCQVCGEPTPENPHRPTCPWGPKGLIEQLRLVLKEG